MEANSLPSSPAIESSPSGRVDHWRALALFGLALLLVAAAYLLEARTGLSLADEGWLWYDTVATARGEVPIRDFNSYEPGRYWWGAAWSWVFGDGILALRKSGALFMVLGLWFGLMAMSRVVKSWPVLFLIGVLLAAWMLPRHKVFESGMAMAGVFFAVWWLARPDRRRTFAAGVFVGIAALVGRNHGLYNLLGFLSLVLLVHFKSEPGPPLFGKLARFGAGIALGWLPMIVMLLFVKGVFGEYWGDLEGDFLFSRNPLPIIWPWRLERWSFKLSRLNEIFTAFAPLLLPLFYGTVIYRCLRAPLEKIREWRVVAAAAFIGVFYLHHAFYRADFSHLAQAAHPFILAAMALPGLIEPGRRRRALIGGFAVLGIFSFLQTLPAHHLYMRLTSSSPYQRVDIRGDEIWINERQARVIEEIRRQVNQEVKPGESLLIVPHSPGLYVILDRKSPIREGFLYMEVTEKRQRRAIGGIESQKVEWVLLGDKRFDDMEERDMESAHPLLWNYLRQNYCPLGDGGTASGRKLRRRCRPWPNGPTGGGR